MPYGQNANKKSPSQTEKGYIKIPIYPTTFLYLSFKISTTTLTSKIIFELPEITILYFACKNNIFLLFSKIFSKKMIEIYEKSVYI